MVSRTYRRIPNRRTPNRSWGGTFTATGQAVAGNTKVLLGGFTLSNANIDETVLRTVGRLAIKSDQTAADEEQIGAFGMIIVNDLAVAAGAASVPGPITDRDDDGWFVYVPIVQSLDFASGVGIEAQMSTGYPFDSKAKRRVQEGFQIAMVVENGHATSAFTIAFVIRVLSQITGA